MSLIKERVGPEDIGRPHRISASLAIGSLPGRRALRRHSTTRFAALPFYGVLCLSMVLYVAALMLDAWSALLVVSASAVLAIAGGLACADQSRQRAPARAMSHRTS